MKTRRLTTLLLLLFVLTFVNLTTNVKAAELPTSSYIEDNSNFLAYATTDDLNLREEPSTNSKILATLNTGDIFVVTDQIGKWFSVNYDGLAGYIYWQYISFVEDEPDDIILGSSIIHYKSSTNRDINMSIAASTINGIVIEPGEEFRWSTIVGNTTEDKGYMPAPVIINGESVTGIGGGVCQVSTTLYNALLDTGITPTERHKHSKPSAYSNNDATVAYGSKDFAFINEYDFHIRIDAYSYKAFVFVNI